jgi:hypothetical protein
MRRARTVFPVSDAVEDLGRCASYSLQTIEQQFCVAVVELNVVLHYVVSFFQQRRFSVPPQSKGSSFNLMQQ